MKKYSRQRDAVLSAVRSVRSHPTAADIYHAVRKELPNISLATVYRNLSELCSDGLVNAINTDGGITRYDGFTDEHSHMICSGCGKIVDINVPSFDIDISSAKDCKIDGYSVVFYGKCAECMKEN